MKMAMEDGKIMLIEVDNMQMAIIKSWNSMKYDRRRSMMIGDCSKELLDKLSKIVRLPPAIESYRQQLDETQRAVDKMRVEKEPKPLVSYPVQQHQWKQLRKSALMDSCRQATSRTESCHLTKPQHRAVTTAALQNWR